MAHDKKQPIETGDTVLVRCCRLHGEKTAPGYVFLRTEPDAEGFCRELAVPETRCLVDGDTVLVPAKVENAHVHQHGRNLLLLIEGETPAGDNRFAISSLCVQANQERPHGTA
jgi:hypothetical protein